MNPNPSSQAYRSVLALSLAFLFLLAGCTSWTPRAERGDEVTMVASFRSGGSELAEHREVMTAGLGSGYGADFDAAVIGAQEGDVITTGAVLMTRQDTIGPYPIPEQPFPRAQLEEFINRTSTVGTTFVPPRSPFTWVVVAQNATDVRARAVVPEGQEVAAFGGVVAFSPRGDNFVGRVSYAKDMLELDMGQFVPDLALPEGSYILLDHEAGFLRFLRLDPPTAQCPPGPPSVWSPVDVQDIEGETVEVTLLACNFPGPVTWQWATSQPGTEYTSREATLQHKVPEVTERSGVVFSATATSGAATAQATVAINYLLEGESDKPATIAAKVLRVERDAEEPVGDSVVGERSSVRLEKE